MIPRSSESSRTLPPWAMRSTSARCPAPDLRPCVLGHPGAHGGRSVRQRRSDCGACEDSPDGGTDAASPLVCCPAIPRCGYDPAKYMMAPTTMPTIMPPTNKALIESLSLTKAAGHAPKRQTTNITAPSFIWSVALVFTGAAEGAGFACTGFVAWPADTPQFRQKLSAGSIGFPHLPQNIATSAHFSFRFA